jgi:hypothetical protein
MVPTKTNRANNTNLNFMVNYIKVLNKCSAHHPDGIYSMVHLEKSDRHQTGEQLP